MDTQGCHRPLGASNIIEVTVSPFICKQANSGLLSATQFCLGRILSNNEITQFCASQLQIKENKKNSQKQQFVLGITKKIKLVNLDNHEITLNRDHHVRVVGAVIRKSKIRKSLLKKSLSTQPDRWLILAMTKKEEMGYCLNVRWSQNNTPEFIDRTGHIQHLVPLNEPVKWKDLEFEDFSAIYLLDYKFGTKYFTDNAIIGFFSK